MNDLPTNDETDIIRSIWANTTNNKLPVQESVGSILFNIATKGAAKEAAKGVAKGVAKEAAKEAAKGAAKKVAKESGQMIFPGFGRRPPLKKTSTGAEYSPVGKQDVFDPRQLTFWSNKVSKSGKSTAAPAVEPATITVKTPTAAPATGKALPTTGKAPASAPVSAPTTGKAPASTPTTGKVSGKSKLTAGAAGLIGTLGLLGLLGKNNDDNVVPSTDNVSSSDTIPNREGPMLYWMPPEKSEKEIQNELKTTAIKIITPKVAVAPAATPAPAAVPAATKRDPIMITKMNKSGEFELVAADTNNNLDLGRIQRGSASDTQLTPEEKDKRDRLQILHSYSYFYERLEQKLDEETVSRAGYKNTNRGRRAYQSQVREYLLGSRRASFRRRPTNTGNQIDQFTSGQEGDPEKIVQVSQSVKDYDQHIRPHVTTLMSAAQDQNIKLPLEDVGNRSSSMHQKLLSLYPQGHKVHHASESLSRALNR